MTEDGLQACQLEASGAASPREFRRIKEACLETIDARLAAGREAANGEARDADRLEAERRVASAAERYSHCLLNQAAIQHARNEEFGLQGPAIGLTRRLGTSHPRAVEARRKRQEAYDRLEELIPIPMRGDMPLVPDAAVVFSSCNREDFFGP